MLQLRPAGYNDFTAISQVHAESWKNAYRGILSDEYLDKEVDADRLKYWIGKRDHPPAGQQILLAENDNTIIGFNCFYLDESAEFGSFIDNLHVLPPYQKTGAGRQLMKASAKVMEQSAKSRKMYLWVFEANQNARAFYEKVGGTCYETVEKGHEDGSKALVCRYVWNDISVLII